MSAIRFVDGLHLGRPKVIGTAAVGDGPLPAQPIDPPTLSMTFAVNDSPFAGKDGDKVQSRVIRDRLLKEASGLSPEILTTSKRGMDGMLRVLAREVGPPAVAPN